MKTKESHSIDNNLENSIALGAGCFWCVEGVFSMIKGVISTTIGYGGGNSENPTYTSVSATPDGHAEITILKFDPLQTSLDQILTVFFAMHNPNKTYIVNDKKGELYRSVILYQANNQRSEILNFIAKYESEISQKINTEILPFKNFNAADDKYQSYYSSNPDKPFCKNVIGPKLKKLKAKGIF